MENGGEELAGGVAGEGVKERREWETRLEQPPQVLAPPVASHGIGFLSLDTVEDLE